MSATHHMWLVLSVVIYMTLVPLSSPFEICGVDLAKRLMEISDEGLGHEEIQKLFDTRATFKMNLLNGDDTVQMLASSLGERFNKYNGAIKSLQKVIVDSFDQLRTVTNTTDTQDCCKVNDTKLTWNENLNTKENSRRPHCYRAAQHVTSLPIDMALFEKQAKSNRDVIPTLGLQYLGTETGVTVHFPGTKQVQSCANNFDPRVRPWYAEASAPTPKDIVILFEITDGETAVSIKEAVAILLNTTNPNDRITVMAFDLSSHSYLGSSKDSPCYSKNLALATPLNRKAFLGFVQENLPSKRKSTAVKYYPAIRDAFKYFKNSDDHTKRSKLLVFMAASDPLDIETQKQIKEKIEEDNAQNVVIQTYSFGTGLSENTRNILRAMAENTEFTTPGGTVKNGTYTAIDSESDLRVQLHSYYDIFADSTIINNPIVTVPYVDFSGLGLVISLCLPVHSKGELRGVACVDAKIEDIFFNVTYYPQSSNTYVFIIDSRGRTILHPRLPKPIARQEDPVFIDITTLERADEASEIISSMKSGGNGSKSFFTHQPSHRPEEGASFETVVAQYYWTKVPHTDYSLCIVFTDNHGTVEMKLSRTENDVAYIHPNWLVGDTNRARLCQHASTRATKAGSVVMFSGAAYRSLTNKVSQDDEKQRHRYDNYLKERAYDQVPALKKSTQLWVELSGLIDDVWTGEMSSRYDSIILWRHLVTASGVIRVYPGTLYAAYDPSILEWYKLATLNLGWLHVQHVDRDNFNLIISQAIFKGSSSGHHTSTDLPVAVVAGEIKSTFVHNMLKDLYPACREEARCFVIDQSGYILAHKDYMDNEKQASYLSTMEPAIAQHLYANSLMVKTTCLDFENYRTQTSYTLTLNDFVVTSESPRYELHSVPGTNVLVGIMWDKNTGAKPCNCQHVTNCLPEKNDHCKCPCYEKLKFNFCNNTLPDPLPTGADTRQRSSDLKLVPTCSILKKQFDIIRPHDNIAISALNPCFVTSCSSARVMSECLEADSCTWCLVEGNDKPTCHKTELNLKCIDPGPPPPSSRVAVVVAVVVVLLFLLLLLVVIFILYRYRPEYLHVCCSCLIKVCCPGRTIAGKTANDKIPAQAMESPSIVNLPRAPERPPGNSYVEYGGEVPRTAPTPPSMAGRERINQAYVDDNLYYEVPGGGVKQHFSQRNTSSRTSHARQAEDRNMPPEQYIHPHLPGPSLASSNFPASSVSNEPRPPNVFFRPIDHSSDIDEATRRVTVGSNKSNPVVTYTIEQQRPTGDQANLGPLAENMNDPYHQSHPPQHQQQQPYQQKTQPPYQPQQQLPPYHEQRQPPLPETGRKSTVPPIPKFPQGHPYYKPETQTSVGPVSPYEGHPRANYNQFEHQRNPSESTESYQSEPHDLSRRSQLSGRSQPTTDSRAGYRSPSGSTRSPQNNRHPPYVENQGPLNLTKKSPRRVQSEPGLTNEHVTERPPQFSLPPQSNRHLSHNPNVPANRHREYDEDYYVNEAAVERPYSVPGLDLSLTELYAHHPNNDQYPEHRVDNNPDNLGAHGGEPINYLPQPHHSFNAGTYQGSYRQHVSADSGLESEYPRRDNSATVPKYL